jgi:N-methylhydantoinase A
VEYHFTRTRRALLRRLDPAEVEALYQELEAEAVTRLREDGFAGNRTEVTRSASLHYEGQSFELAVSVPPGPLDREVLASLEEAYGVEHERTYGHRAGADEPVELVTLKVIGRAIPDAARSALAANANLVGGVAASGTTRKAWFGANYGWLDAKVFDRADLATPQSGPCIVDEYDSTCVVPPGWTASLDRHRNIVLHEAMPAALAAE